MDIHGNESSRTLEERSNHRTITDILKDIGSVLRHMIRAEISLALSELTESARQAKSSALLFAVGGVVGIFGFGFVLLAALFALNLALPAWLSALILGAILLACASIGIANARESLKKVRVPRRAIQSAKEDFEWMREQLRP